MSDGGSTGGTLALFRGTYVWAGVAFALGGFLAEELSGNNHVFEVFMLFGGFFLGTGVERNHRGRS